MLFKPPHPKHLVTGFIVVTALLVQPVVAADPGSHPLLKSTQQHLSESSSALPAANHFASRQWLADEPSLSIMRWQSDSDPGGTDETEVTLELSLLTPTQRQLISRFNSLSARLKQIEQQQLQLQISAFLRDHFWRFRRTQATLTFYRDIVAQLKQLEQQTERRLQAQNATGFDRILIQQRVLTYQAKIQQQQLSLQTLTRQWQQITGQKRLPETLAEPENEPLSITQHPQLMLLQLQWQIATAEAENEAEQSKSWTVSAGFKKNESVNSSDNQLGIGVSIPLSFSGSLSALSSQALKSQQQKILTALQQQQLNLQAEVQHRIGQVQQARQQLKLTEQTKVLSNQAINQLQQLHESQQITTRRFIDRLIEQWQYRYQYQIAEIELESARAQLNQAKGTTL
ncbi:TolC family protein [Idiomarina seosinensis]|uniref:TolC family protein n=1 Tax=Idiomarina seosinensis TaxID=281739 RepID=UPI00384C5CE4